MHLFSTIQFLLFHVQNFVTFFTIPPPHCRISLSNQKDAKMRNKHPGRQKVEIYIFEYMWWQRFHSNRYLFSQILANILIQFPHRKDNLYKKVCFGWFYHRNLGHFPPRTLPPGQFPPDTSPQRQIPPRHFPPDHLPPSTFPLYLCVVSVVVRHSLGMPEVLGSMPCPVGELPLTRVP